MQVMADDGLPGEGPRAGAMAEVRDVTGTPGPLAGRVVVVTGTARGLGRAYTGELVRQGAAVVAADMDEAALIQTAEALGNGVHPHVCDITDPQAPRALLDAALSRFGQLRHRGRSRPGLGADALAAGDRVPAAAGDVPGPGAGAAAAGARWRGEPPGAVSRGRGPQRGAGPAPS